MRPRYQSFEDLVNQNKQELWEDEYKIKQIEQRLDKKVTSQKSDKMDQLQS
ncbi:FbpB family small basic protein [Lentibacillus sp. CBA3610]|uniref:FbpB family small basic protein n=1 Tax=Lentibacillus sp. CBA3610 TaxID=2518176 RepID=UPI001595650B|nr:FbpB family small basic protein [Lentibacillus sp. CBA3610]QKY68893.1 FbpB family small basic protein [Lentibacillus sp. CBA3610]